MAFSSRHFTLAELTHSNTAVAQNIPNQPGPKEADALQALCSGVLDPLRESLGRPITVNCAYRSPVLNARVGGVPNSQHLSGQAADIQADGTTVLDLFKLVVKLGLPYDQVIYEARSPTSKWVHVSHVDGPNRGEIRVAKFVGGKAQSYPLVTREQALALTEVATRSMAPPTHEEGADEPDFDDLAAAPVAKRAARKTAAKKAAPKKVAAKKSAPKRKAPARSAAKKAPAKKAAAKKSAPKKAAAKKSAPKKAAAKKSAPKKAAAKKSAPKKAGAKKAAPKKAAAKKAPPKKAAAKKAAPKKAVAKKAAASRRPRA